MILQVAVGVVRNSQDEVLITKRPAHVHLGGFWEFPGGKIEINESAKRALIRELREELGIEVITAQPLIKVQHDYSDRQVLLDAWQVERYAGVVTGKEGQQVLWVKPEQLSDFSFPEANQTIIETLKRYSLCSTQ